MSKGNMMKLKTTDDFKSIVLNEKSLIDVRAPIEYEKGSFPNAVNIPLMDDEQRHLIGIKYKEEGNESAVKLGHQLVSGEDKQSKINQWVEYFQAHPDSIIFCFRGGQRSRISQDWIQSALNREILRIEGGYKAFRNYLLDALEPENQNFNPIRLGGHTGSGKTQLIYDLKHSVDLEGIAHHRGSSFGNYIEPQPNQINFENQLAYTLIQKQEKGFSHLVFEDEGRHIGRCFVPVNFSNHYRSSPLVVLQVPLKERAENILDEYVKNSQSDFTKAFGEQGLAKWLEYVTASVTKAKKRLGGDRYQEMMRIIYHAYDVQLKTGDINDHLLWIHYFLTDYYDPMYEYQLEQNKDFIVFKGNTDAVKQYLNSTCFC